MFTFLDGQFHSASFARILEIHTTSSCGRLGRPHFLAMRRRGRSRRFKWLSDNLGRTHGHRSIGKWG